MKWRGMDIWGQCPLNPSMQTGSPEGTPVLELKAASLAALEPPGFFRPSRSTVGGGGRQTPQARPPNPQRPAPRMGSIPSAPLHTHGSLQQSRAGYWRFPPHCAVSEPAQGNKHPGGRRAQPRETEAQRQGKAWAPREPGTVLGQEPGQEDPHTWLFLLPSGRCRPCVSGHFHQSSLHAIKRTSLAWWS